MSMPFVLEPSLTKRHLFFAKVSSLLWLHGLYRITMLVTFILISFWFDHSFHISFPIIMSRANLSSCLLFFFFFFGNLLKIIIISNFSYNTIRLKAHRHIGTLNSQWVSVYLGTQYVNIILYLQLKTRMSVTCDLERNDLAYKFYWSIDLL